MTQSPFEVASAVTEVGPNRFTATVPDGWQQGRGAFGGLVLATLLRAMQRCEPDPARAVRTLIGDLCGPVLVGPAEIEVVVLRRGANQTNLRAELRQGGEVLAFAGAVLSTPRPVGLPGLRPKIELPSREGAFLVPHDAPLKPVFTKHFDYEVVGALPFTGGAEPAVTGFIRERVAPSKVDAPAIIALLDAYWPAFFTTVTAPRPTATVSFTAEIVGDLGALDPATPLVYRARTVCDHEGFQPEQRELFTPAGELVALNHQTFVVIK
ncbi:MAG: thioesterase family protein [Labilithrix sp.]|nr:thioesterase family protein [Labilithrix sp.]MCW5813232.1 thioesterase family protein [Labilithrix sp.]